MDLGFFSAYQKESLMLLAAILFSCWQKTESLSLWSWILFIFSFLADGVV